MNEKTARKRRLKQLKITEKINGDANKLLRREIFRLARHRDILGLVVIGLIIVIVVLSLKIFL